MFHTNFPQPLCCFVIWEFKPDCALELFQLSENRKRRVSNTFRQTADLTKSNETSSHLSRPDLDVEVVPLVGDLKYFGPGEAIDAEFISVDEEAAGTNSQHDLHTLRILRNTRQREHLTGTVLNTQFSVKMK